MKFKDGDCQECGTPLNNAEGTLCSACNADNYMED